MKINTGIDIEEISRFKHLLEKPRFFEKYFGEDEFELFITKGLKPQTIAANFCAKEALSKALGTGIRGFSLKDIQLLRDDLGCPYFKLSGNISELCKDKKIAVSVSHTRQYATAVVVLYME